MGTGRGAARRRVLDAGALIALERGDRRVAELIRRGEPGIVIPAPVLAQAWRGGAGQARLSAVVASAHTTIEAFDELDAKAAGILLGRAGASDVADASVVLAARRNEAFVITTDAADIRRLDPELPIAEI